MSGFEMPSRLGRYEIVRELGKGAMGIVYEGFDPSLGRRVAIKTARRDVMEASGLAEEMMERFLREARSTGVLDHPNIITIYDAGTEGEIAYIAMEFLEGGNLRDLLDRRRSLEPAEVAEIGAVICDALAVAHAQGIVHRDIKPANIMTPADKPIKLADFGIAHITDSNLTQDGALVGTPHYMSPEQFMGQRLDGRSDLFSVGVMLYELLTGEKPFTGEALTTVMHHVMKSQPAEPKELNYSVNEALSRVIMKSMAKRPQNRYADGTSMAAALRESMKDHPDPVVLGFEEAPPAPPKPVAPEKPAPPRVDMEDSIHLPTLLSVSDGTMDIKAEREAVRRAQEDVTVDLPAPEKMSPSLTANREQAAPETARHRWPVIMGAMVAVSAVALAMGWALRGAGDGSTAGGPAITVPVEAHYTTDSGVWLAFSELTDPAAKAEFLDEQERAGKVVPLSGGLIEVFDGESNLLLDQQPIDDTGEGSHMLRITGEPESVRFLVNASINGQATTDEFVMRGKDQWSRRQVFLLHK